MKLTGHIAFPLHLNLAPFLSPDSPERPQGQPGFRQQLLAYRLTGVLVHKGSWSSAGHYFSYVLDSGELQVFINYACAENLQAACL